MTSLSICLTPHVDPGFLLIYLCLSWDQILNYPKTFSLFRVSNGFCGCLTFLRCDLKAMLYCRSVFGVLASEQSKTKVLQQDGRRSWLDRITLALRHSMTSRWSPGREQGQAWTPCNSNSRGSAGNVDLARMAVAAILALGISSQTSTVSPIKVSSGPRAYYCTCVL